MPNKKKSQVNPHDIANYLIENKERIIKTNRSNKLIYLYYNGYWNCRESVPILETRIEQILNEQASNHMVDEIIGHIRRKTYLSSDEIKNNRRYISCNNFIYDIEADRQLAFTPDIFVTTKIPITYNPAQSTEEIEKYTKGLVSKDDYPKLQEHLGDILSPHTTSKKLLYLYGGRNSGKSTLLNIIGKLIGKRNYCTLTLTQLNEKFTNFTLYEKMANICSETPYKFSDKTLEHIKTLTGGDYITIQQKHGPAFDYQPVIKHIFAANGIPRIDREYADSAFFSRFDFIEFPNSFGKNPNIISQYTTEEMKSAWLNWLIEGYRRLRDNEWQFTKALDVYSVERLFTSSDSVGDPLVRWLTKHYTLSATGFIEKEQLHKDYIRHCNENSITLRYSYSYPTFCKRMLSQDIIPVTSTRRGPKGNQKHVFLGIKKSE